METSNPTQSNTTQDNGESCQVAAKTSAKSPKRVARSGQTSVAYWKEKLYRNTYKDRSGAKVWMPEHYVRIRHDGVTQQVRLSHADKDRAAEEALRLFLRVRDEGWGVITARKARLPASPSIAEFCDAYRQATASMERAPRPISIATYTRSLLQLCELAGVKQLRELTREAIEHGRDAYRRKARAEGRADSAIQNSVAKVLRNAAACFSVEALAVLRRSGLAVENPFLGIKRTQEIQPTSPLPAAALEAIWADAAKLRDGDPNAIDPTTTAFSKRYRKTHGREPQWRNIDFRKPHPNAYAALLLALGAGLRANEIDKARWSWLKIGPRGEHFIEIGEEADFRPKGGSRRLIRIPKDLHNAITQTRSGFDSPYIIGGPPKDGQEEGYRRPDVFRAVNLWIRGRIGVGRNPLHRLRKQFGSEVATAFGLFAAQKLLGHSSPTVTAKYYAAQTELPELTHVRIVG